MSSISNFTQAMRELTGFDDDVSKEKVNKAEKRIETDKKEKDESFAVLQRKEYVSPEMEIFLPEFNRETGTMISSSMIINGTVEGADQVRADGSVFGDLHTTSSVLVSGKVTGDVAADSLSVSGNIKGNVSVRQDMRIEPAAVVVGGIKSTNLQIKGKVKGDLKVRKTVDITASAVVVGDIDAGELNSERGCMISGNVITRNTHSQSFDEEQLFNIGE